MTMDLAQTVQTMLHKGIVSGSIAEALRDALPAPNLNELMVEAERRVNLAHASSHDSVTGERLQDSDANDQDYEDFVAAVAYQDGLRAAAAAMGYPTDAEGY